MSFKYNVVENDGQVSSVSVFIGAESYIATPQHPNFQRILDALRGSEPITDEKIAGMFDTGRAINDNFVALSERVSVQKSRLYLDGDPMDDALAKAIIRFYVEGNDDFKPLVNFLEKIATNPNPHSREHLFRWLRDKEIGICPDGDFIAYKGLDSTEHSITAGTAMVNGKVITGKIPNKPDTVIEMPRSKVTFDPRNGCSTGLHAGNWRYAQWFSKGAISIVKINPRDVVSVPTDSSDEKLRVCRYRVLRRTQVEDKSALFAPDIERTAKLWEPTPPRPPRKRAAAAAKKAPAKKAPKPVEPEFPKFYEEFSVKHWRKCNVSELRWIAKEWEITIPGGISKAKAEALIPVLQKEARRRKQTW